MNEELGNTARSSDRLAQLPIDPRIVSLQVEVSDAASVVAPATAAADVTLLINNAGVLDFGSVMDAPMAAFKRNFATDFYGVLGMSRAFAPVVEKNGGGVIVNLLTLMALASMPGLGVYNASNAETWSLTQSMRARQVARKIAVFSVFPGAVDTDMLAGVEMPKTSPADIAAVVMRVLHQSTEDIFPDAMFSGLYAAWKADHKAIEKQFAAVQRGTPAARSISPHSLRSCASLNGMELE